MFKKTHTAILIIGIVYISVGIFHTNIWFDESYSIAIANHTFAEIWTITANDVHPPLYYWMLRTLNLIFGQNILIYRIFSMSGIAMTALLGYTHIRKHYNEKIGLFFSFAVLFLPITCIYANEIRMYSWTMFFVTLTYIYANQFIKNYKTKNLIFFCIASLAGAYIHYYGLLASAVINFFILFILLKNKRKRELIRFIFAAAFQIALYFPWLVSLLKQVNTVSGGFWISLTFPDTLIEVLGFQFGGDLTLMTVIQLYAAFFVSLILYLYIGYKFIYEKDKVFKQAKRAMTVYLTVILTALLISLALKTPILYARYLLAVTGVWIISLSCILYAERKKITVILICAVILSFSVFNTYALIIMNYDGRDLEQITFLQDTILPDDIIIYTDIGIGSVYAVYFQDQQQYFYNPENWGVELAYQAYAPQMTTVTDLSFLDGYSGRIWLIDCENMYLYNQAFKNSGYLFISSKLFETAYHDYIYNVILLDK